MNKIDKMHTFLYPIYNLPLNGGDMQKVNGYNFYQIGTFIHPFMELKQGVKLSDIIFQVFQAKAWLWDLDHDKLVPLVVSKEAIRALYWSLNEILPNDADWSRIDMEQEIDF